MLTCRRFIAFLMIVLFLPDAALARASLQLCLGNDGHRVVEPLAAAHLHGGHASVQKAAAERLNLPPDTVPRCQGDECRDVLIGKEALSSTRNNSELIHKIASDQPGKILMVPSTPPLSYGTFIKAAIGTGSTFVIVRDPRLVSHATVVLLN